MDNETEDLNYIDSDPETETEKYDYEYLKRFYTYPETALRSAAEQGKEEIVRRLIQEDLVDLNNTKDPYGNTALHHAARKGHSNVVKILVDSGANIEAKNNFNQTAVHLAIQSPNTVATLIEAGGGVNLQDNDGNTALHLAARNQEQLVGTVVTLLKKGADSNLQNDNGDTALHLAAVHAFDDGKIFKALMYLGGAKADISNNAGKTAFDIALEENSLAAVFLCIECMVLTKTPKPSCLNEENFVEDYSQYWDDTEFLNNEIIGKINGEDISLLDAVSLEHTALALARDPEIREKMSANAQRYKRECPERFPEIKESFRKAYHHLGAVDALYHSAYTTTQESNDRSRDISNMELKLKNYDVAELVAEQMSPEEKQACTKAYLLSKTVIQAESFASVDQNQPGPSSHQLPNVSILNKERKREQTNYQKR